MRIFTQPVRMQVLHPKFGVYETMAFCALDAKMQAFAHWGISPQEEAGCKVAVERTAILAPQE